ncbi:MAG: hypothetical protein ABMA26_04805, partial [Limisphaerales bacterium]
LVSLMGGPGLTLAEVNRVMEQVNRQTENAHLMMGAAIEEALGDRLTVTLVASRQRSHAADLPKGEEPGLPEPAPASRGGEDFDLLGSAIASKPVTRTTVAKPESERVTAAVAETVTEAAAPAPVVTSRSWRSRKKTKAVHPELGLETVTTGPFQQSEPTRRNGVNLDVPTFVRRGMVMN